MGKPLNVQIGQIFGGWEIIEVQVINPETKRSNCINKPIFNKGRCIYCHQTERYFLNGDLKNASSKCNKCSLIERNTKDRQIQIGQIYGYLEVTGDAGYEFASGGKRRHCSYCKCLLCGKENVKKFDNQLISGNTSSCGCLCSLGEQKIKQLLSENNISFKHDSAYDLLTKETGRRLRFDFILLDQNDNVVRFIEFDGQQHFEGFSGRVWKNEEDFQTISERDNIKNNFCISHNIPLVRIPYSKLKTLQIEDLLSNKYVINERGDA